MYKYTYKGKTYTHKKVDKLQKLLEKDGYKGNVALQLLATANKQEELDVADILTPVETQLVETEVVEIEQETMDDIKDGTLVLEDDANDSNILH